MKTTSFFLGIMIALVFTQCNNSNSTNTKTSDMSDKEKMPFYSNTDSSKLELNNDELKKTLPADVYRIAREKGTERPWTSAFEKSKEVGTYYCAVCGNALFKSDTKLKVVVVGQVSTSLSVKAV